MQSHHGVEVSPGRDIVMSSTGRTPSTSSNEGKVGLEKQVSEVTSAYGIDDVRRTLGARGDGRSRASVGESSNIIQHDEKLPASGVPTMRISTSSDRSAQKDKLIKARQVSQRLLALCRCSQCDNPIKEPITLPCGHSSCLSCILDATSSFSKHSSRATLPCSSHLPPRLPMSPTTVPCPVAGCPRSAIGKGMGLWAGHSALYGAEANGDELETPVTEDMGPGSAPMDGFVVPENRESNRLVIIPAQKRASSSQSYAISKYSLQSISLAEGEAKIRPDVTLTKAVDLLRRYAGHSSTSPSSPVTFRQRMSSTDRRGGHQRGARITYQQTQEHSSLSSSPPSHEHPAGTRTEINPYFHSILGVSEKGRETGALGGIRATYDSDDEEDAAINQEAWQSRKVPSQRSQDEFGSSPVEDEQDDEIMGAFARQYTSKSPSTSPPSKFTPTSQSLTLEALQADLLDVLECQLCYQLLYQPLTTPCGHTFCQQCFARSLDHSSNCPLCRTDMPTFSFFHEHPSNNIILNLLTAEWEEKEEEEATLTLDKRTSEAKQKEEVLGLQSLYMERKMTMEREASESLLSTPLFVCTLAFPHMPTILHIFEPRYRLMIRRCLESGHPRFGMVMASQETSGPVAGMSRYGTMLEIKSVKMLPDGRSMIETIGSHRFRVLAKGSIDGYTTGQIERIDDVSDEAEDHLERVSMGIIDSDASPSIHEEAREAQMAFQAALGINLSRNDGEEHQANPILSIALTQFTSKQLVETCTGFIETLRSGSAPWLMTRLNNTYGPMPDPENVAAFGYWMALVMPIDEHEKSKLLPIRSPRLRLRIVVHWIEQLRQTWWFNHGCSVQ